MYVYSMGWMTLVWRLRGNGIIAAYCIAPRTSYQTEHDLRSIAQCSVLIIASVKGAVRLHIRPALNREWVLRKHEDAREIWRTVSAAHHRTATKAGAELFCWGSRSCSEAENSTPSTVRMTVRSERTQVAVECQLLFHKPAAGPGPVNIEYM
jgi:hypothetical protein